MNYLDLPGGTHSRTRTTYNLQAQAASGALLLPHTTRFEAATATKKSLATDVMIQFATRINMIQNIITQLVLSTRTCDWIASIKKKAALLLGSLCHGYIECVLMV